MNLEYWLRINNARHLSPRLYIRLLQQFGSAKAICGAEKVELAANGVNESAIDELQKPDGLLLKSQHDWAQKPGQTIITFEHSHYPLLLKNIAAPPAVLFIRGDASLLNRPQIAMVGSRTPSPGGIRAATELASELVSAGWIITSGLALGIDAAGHRAALNQGGKTIAVLGSGLDCIYPYRNRSLADEIAQTAALVSEFSPECRPLAKHFPQRNRIISGLCLGICVVEANMNSGSLITAKLGLDQGREIFAVPGSIFNAMASGCHNLIKDGAYLVSSVEDILSVLNQTTAAWGITGPTIKEQKRLELDYNCHKLLQWVGFESTPIDQIVQNSGYSVAKATEGLLSLELAGYIRSIPGGYVRYR